MRVHFHRLILISLLISFWACKNDENKLDGPGVLTLDAQNVTETKATLCGMLNAPDPVALDFEFGFEFSTEPIFTEESTTKLRPKFYDEKHEFTYQLENLVPDTMYYFRAYMINQMMMYLGETKPFTTSSIDLSGGEVSELTCFSALISAKVNAEEEVTSYGVYYSTEEHPAQGSVFVLGSERDIEGNFTCQITALSGSTTYYYCTYAKVGNSWKVGQIGSFTTKEDDVVETGTIDMSNYEIKSKLTINDGPYSSLQMGICYSDSNDVPTIGNRCYSVDERDMDNTFTVNLTSHPYGTTVYYRAYVLIDSVAHYGTVLSFSEKLKMEEDLTYVDMGLSVMWATSNIGAKSEEDYGAYFAWGEKETKDVYDWTSYKWCEGTSTTLTKYNNDSYYGVADNIIKLEIDDDVAHAVCGENWRLPDREEIKELIDNCEWTWTAKNNVYGYLVTSLINNRSIFLPAAGDCNGDSCTLKDTYGWYWLRSLFPGSSAAEIFLFRSDTSSIKRFSRDFYQSKSGTERRVGCSIRPVRPSEAWLSQLSISIRDDSMNLIQGKTYNLKATLKNGDQIVHRDVVWQSDNPSVVRVDNEGSMVAVSKGSAKITVSYETISTSCIVTVVEESKIEHSYVDLGLSVKWSTLNVGAAFPEDFGDYIAWENTGYYSGGGERDVARMRWGNEWRMPTKEEFEELLNDCTWTWTTQKDVNGYLVTSNKEGYSNRCIFLPAAGHYESMPSYPTPSLSGNGEGGGYWSSSKRDSYPYALTFGSTAYSMQGIYFYYIQNVCYPVRPVHP